MSLKPGSKAPDFTLPDASGKPFHLYEILKQKPVVLFFYPKDFTRGCTREVCAFRDDYSFFRERGIEVVGISNDGEASHRKYAEVYTLPFTLLSDKNRQVAQRYHAVYPFGLLSRRITCFIEKDGMIKAAFDSFLNAEGHIESMKNEILKMETGQ